MAPTTETVEGYVIDVACVRKNPRDELLESARTQTKECALMGHCVESGYSLVTEEDRLTVLDPAATPEVVSVVEDSGLEEGIRLHVTREDQEDEMETVSIEEA